MTTPAAAYHSDISAQFLAKAHRYLAEGDLLQASEKGWGATARMVKAVAEERGWDNSTHRDLYRAIDRVEEELGDDRVQILFRSASALHQNFYEGDMFERSVATGLNDVEEITTLLMAVID